MADYQGINDTNSSSYSGNDSLVQGTSVAPNASSRGIIEKHPAAYFLETYYSFFLLIFGTVGNLLSLAVMSRKTFRKNILRPCLCTLALADLTALYTGPLYFSAKEVFGHDFRLTNDASCGIHRCVSFIAVDLSVWTLVVLSITRLVYVVWPMKKIINQKRTFITLIVILFIIIGVNSPKFFMYGIVVTRSGQILCDAVTPSYRYFNVYIFDWIVFAKVVIIPPLILLATNFVLVRFVIRSRRRLQGIRVEDPPQMSVSVQLEFQPTQITNSGDSTYVGDQPRDPSLATAPSFKHPQGQGGQGTKGSCCWSRGHGRSTRKSAADHRAQKQRNMTVTVIGVNCIFLICSLPIAIFITSRAYLFNTKTTVASPQYVFEIFSNYTFYTNNAINFVLYCITMRNFRQELKDMFLHCWSTISRCCSRKR